MKKPVLVVMAAGMGSRYGGLKQIDPVDKEGHIIMDFSIFDAVKAGFEKVVFIIKKENEQDFRAAIGDRLSEKIKVSYVFQELTNLPEGYVVPEGRVKPWGTGHAIMSWMHRVIWQIFMSVPILKKEGMGPHIQRMKGRPGSLFLVMPLYP